MHTVTCQRLFASAALHTAAVSAALRPGCCCRWRWWTAVAQTAPAAAAPAMAAVGRRRSDAGPGGLQLQLSDSSTCTCAVPLPCSASAAPAHHRHWHHPRAASLPANSAATAAGTASIHIEGALCTMHMPAVVTRRHAPAARSRDACATWHCLPTLLTTSSTYSCLRPLRLNVLPQVVVPKLISNGLRWQCSGDFSARQCLQYRGVMPVCADPSLGSPDGAILRAALEVVSGMPLYCGWGCVWQWLEGGKG
jgi:hypothetical protein